MARKTELSKTLINSYRVALYRVTGPDAAFVMKVKKVSEPLADLMTRYGADSALFITAENPFGKKMPSSDNLRALKALQTELKSMGLRLWNGQGEDPSGGTWKAETSFLALGLSLEDSKVLGEKYKQNAVIWADADAVPQLILLR